jgi:peptidoglycan/xylan/chitin deacetylase (PgdA/CDA1 family)
MKIMRWTVAIIWVLNVVLAVVVAGLWWMQVHQPVEPSASDGVPHDVQQMLDQLRTYKIYHGNPARKWIALTFDDGPHPYHTPVLLKTLRRLHVRATFFVVGRNVDRYPELVRQMVEDGHEVENHTYNHLRLSQMPLGIVHEEIEAGAAAIWRATGRIPRFVRPPGGMTNHAVRQVAQFGGYVTVMWTDDPADYERPPVETLRQRLFAHVRPGSIILLHEKVPQTVQVLPEFVAEMRRRGYQFVTVEEMWKDMQRSVLQVASHERGGLPSPLLGGS